MILSPEQIKQRLRQLGIRSDKYLGQHFLIDQSVLDTIQTKVNELKRPNDIFVEVGPGLGVLTELLVQESEHVVTIERDPILARSLEGFLKKPNVTIIQNDILRLLETNPGFPVRFNKEKIGKIQQIDPVFATIDDSICFDNPGSEYDWLFVANIPYGITSPLLRKLVNLETPPRHIIVLVQKEVAERLIAKPGNSSRGLLTIEIELAGQTEIVQTVPPNSFWPEPKVKSALIHIDLTQPKIGLSEKEHDALFKVVTAGFSAKRKQLLNSLAGGLGLSQESTRELLKKAAIEPSRRAETLTLEEWVRLNNTCHPELVEGSYEKS